MNDTSNQEPTRQLLTVKQFSKKHPAFSQASLRFLIFNAETRKTSKADIVGNGLSTALLRIGRKILIDEDKFFAWVESQQA